MRRYLLLLVLPAASWLLGSCSSENLEDLAGTSVPVPCDTTAVTYLDDIEPIVRNNCRTCHNSNIANGGRNYDTYAGIHAVATEQRNGVNLLIGVVSHAPQISPVQWMPKDLPKLSDCDIAKLEIWVRAGAPNN